MLITSAAMHLVFIGTAVLTLAGAIVIGTALLDSFRRKTPVA